MHNCRSTRQQRLQKEEITRNRSDNDSLSFCSITKIVAIHNPHTTQKIEDRKQVVCRVVDHNYSRGGAKRVILSSCSLCFSDLCVCPSHCIEASAI